MYSRCFRENAIFLTLSASSWSSSTNDLIYDWIVMKPNPSVITNNIVRIFWLCLSPRVRRTSVILTKEHSYFPQFNPSRYSLYTSLFISTFQGVVFLVFVEIAYLWLLFIELRKPPPVEKVCLNVFGIYFLRLFYLKQKLNKDTKLAIEFPKRTKRQFKYYCYITISHKPNWIFWKQRKIFHLQATLCLID